MVFGLSRPVKGYREEGIHLKGNTSIIDNPRHPLHEGVGALSSSFSQTQTSSLQEAALLQMVPSVNRLYNVS